MRRLLLWFFCLLLPAVAWAAVNINSASSAELQTLSGIGPAKARAIIDYRQQHGPFKTVDQLQQVRGFGAKTVKKLAPELKLSGPSEVAGKK
jgi:competence protein ComEA